MKDGDQDLPGGEIASLMIRTSQEIKIPPYYDFYIVANFQNFGKNLNDLFLLKRFLCSLKRFFCQFTSGISKSC